MRILVLGGTVFLSHAVATEAAARGHDVVCLARGVSGAVPDGATLVRWDRTGIGLPPPLPFGEPDAVVDVGRQPSLVRAAVASWPAAHWVFVSTVNVYADDATPGGRPGVTPLVAEIPDDDPDPAAYGGLKVACERAVTEGAASAMVVRPGLIAGPGDPTGRFGYWAERRADGGTAVMGGAPSDVVQVVDVRDLATWIVTGCERRTTGTFDGVGLPTPVGELLGSLDGDAPVEFVDGDLLVEHDVAPWSGERSVPLWLPRPTYDGMLAHDPAPSLAAGLRLRPVAETARDTLTWLRAHPDAVRTGWSRAAEREVLAAWRGRSGEQGGDAAPSA